MAGVSMSLCNQTTPLSGYEHVISHALDFLHLNSDQELALHGQQVALGCLSSSLSYAWLFEQEQFQLKKFRFLSENDCTLLVQSLLKKAPFKDSNQIDISNLHRSFLEDYLEKSNKWIEQRNSLEEFTANWPNIKKKLQELVISPAQLEIILENANLPTYPEMMNPQLTALEYRWALRFSPFVRSRFSLGDFIFWIGEDPCAIAAM
jgi:glycerol-1-phosphate dehydrogenase [NAD(P)+]